MTATHPCEPPVDIVARLDAALAELRDAILASGELADLQLAIAPARRLGGKLVAGQGQIWWTPLRKEQG